MTFTFLFPIHIFSLPEKEILEPYGLTILDFFHLFFGTYLNGTDDQSDYYYIAETLESFFELEEVFIQEFTTPSPGQTKKSTLDDAYDNHYFFVESFFNHYTDFREKMLMYPTQLQQFLENPSETVIKDISIQFNKTLIVMIEIESLYSMQESPLPSANSLNIINNTWYP